MPVPVIKIVKLKITYFPLNVSNTNSIKNIELNVNDNCSLSTVEKMLQREFDCDEEMLFYTYNSNRLGKRLRKQNMLTREVVGLHLGVFPYKLEKPKQTNNLFIVDTFMKKQVKKMMFFNGEDQVCMPFIYLVNGKSTCRELQLQVFRHLYPIITFPKELSKKLEKIASEDERIEFAYKMAFEESSFADEELYELVLINNRESSEG